MNIHAFLRRQFTLALAPLTHRAAEFALHVRPAQDAKFGDYQANCAMPLRQELGGQPRQIAERIAAGLPDRSIFSSIDVAGPGFINMRLSDDFLAHELVTSLTSPRLGIELQVPGKTIVIDFSSPNVAKPMHVGHLRSTILGDALSRIHRALGWTVHTDNHLGDWGTQFGMLIYGWRNLRDEELAKRDPIAELCRLYQVVNTLSESNEAVARDARAETAKLHDGEAENLALWRTFMPWCLEDLARIYRRLNVQFDHQLGESFYQPMLAATVGELRAKGIAVESEGAVCVFFPDESGKADESGTRIDRFAPMVIQKADGAYTYATTDLACIQYRVEHFRPDAIVYVVDDRQSLHFQQLFESARRSGFTRVGFVHVAFGKILGKDGRPFKTREGGIVGLAALLDEAIARAQAVVDAASPDLPAAERRHIAEVVGIGAVKYADLCQNRTSDYVFDWDKMISLDGNTAAYLQYVYARNRSIFRKGQIDPAIVSTAVADLTLSHPSERSLGVALVRYPEALAQSAADFKPNVLTSYLFDLANSYNDFFRDCPVLKAETDALRQSRLALCELTARTIRDGLDLLGIQTIERM